MNKKDSLYQLGLDYYRGNGLPKDIDIAIDYLIKASDLNHFEAKVLSGKLLFEQSKNPKSIYYEEGYLLGSKLMIEVFRSGKVTLSIPYLLNNEIFNSTCTLEEMENYYQEAYRLGFRETKYELAKVLFKKGSYKSAEQWFLESIKEDISKEAHLYLYKIYQTKEYLNDKKAFIQLKEAIKYGFIPDEFKDFIEEDEQILINRAVFDSQFSVDKIKTEVARIVEHCYYADDAFKKYFSKDRLKVSISFALEVKLLNAMYEYTPAETKESFTYEPYVLTAGYFAETPDSGDAQEAVFVHSKNSGGFFQSKERDGYQFLKLRDLFDEFNLKDQIPLLHSEVTDDDINSLVQLEIKKDIKEKHKDRAKQLNIKVKRFNIYKTLVPSFVISFHYQNKDYHSKKYRFDSEEWKKVFKPTPGELVPPWTVLDFEFPLKESLYDELKELEIEKVKYMRRFNLLTPLKVLLFIAFYWILSIGIRNVFLNEKLFISDFDIIVDIGTNLLWYVGIFGMVLLSYYLTRIKLFISNITNIRQLILENPEFILVKEGNKKHFKWQYQQMIALCVLLIIFVLASGFFFVF